MSQLIKFYFTSSTLIMFRTLIDPSSGACDQRGDTKKKKSQAPDDGCINVRNMLSIEEVK